MKHLTFILLLIASVAKGQTANYSASDYTTHVFSNASYYWNLYDTLSGTNDTLIITIPGAYYGHYGYSLGCTWLSTGTTSSSDVTLQGRNASHETWKDIDDVSFSEEVTTSWTQSVDNGTSGYVYLRLRCTSASGNAHLRNVLVLIRI